MNMLQHNHITHHLKLIPPADTFQPLHKQIPSSRRSQLTMPSKATKSYKMKVPVILISLETNNHPAMLLGLRGTPTL